MVIGFGYADSMTSNTFFSDISAGLFRIVSSVETEKKRNDYGYLNSFLKKIVAEKKKFGKKPIKKLFHSKVLP